MIKLVALFLRKRFSADFIALRIHAVRLLGLTLVSAMLSPVPASFAARAAQASRPPNIIFILADDLGYGDLSAYGQKKFRTPHIDRLAVEGMRFTQHYAGAPVCASSRSALLTGQHTGHTYIRGNKEVQPEGQEPLPAGTRTFATALKQAGYVTGVFGKWGLGYPGSVGAPENQGFDRFFGYNCQRLAHNYYPSHLWDDARRLDLPGNAGGGTAVYAPQLIHERTLAFIEDNRDRPFFCFVATPIPHAELLVPEDYLARHRGQYGPEAPYAGVDSGPDYRLGPYGSQATPKAAYAAMINLLDDQVGEIVATIERLGLSENTLIIFASDNGPAAEGGSHPDLFDSAGGLRGQKRDLYEGGIRVPFIARWPGTVEAGSTSAHLSAFWDLYPTFSELAGTEAPGGIDGLSMVPTLTGRGEQARHDHLYWEFHEIGGRKALRRGPWKLVRYGVARETPGPLELYNLANDPNETTDVAAANPALVRELEQLMEGARTESALFTFGQQGYLQGK
jgi:arylsulfatase A-like enzyme